MFKPGAVVRLLVKPLPIETLGMLTVPKVPPIVVPLTEKVCAPVLAVKVAPVFTVRFPA